MFAIIIKGIVHTKLINNAGSNIIALFLTNLKKSISGFMKAGGVVEAFQKAHEHGRLEVFK